MTDEQQSGEARSISTKATGALPEKMDKAPSGGIFLYSSGPQ